MTSLINSYKDYYENPRHNVRNLFIAITEYKYHDNWQKELEEIRDLKIFFLKKKNYSAFRSSQLCTNGSTVGSPRQYSFALFDLWRFRLESFIRGGKNIRIHNPFHGACVINPFTIKKEMLLCDPSDRDQFKICCDYISELGVNSVVAVPTVWFMISTIPDIREIFITKCKNVKNIVNSDWDIFIQRKHLEKHFLIKDQMIDWYTGACFYTCDYGQYHLLPTFFCDNENCFNLLNLNQIYLDRQDYWKFGVVHDCKCGRKTCDFTFLSHQAHNILQEKTFVENLQSSFYNLQFLFSEKEIHIFYATEGRFLDKEYLIDVLSFHGKEIIFLKNKCFNVANKLYNLWQGSHLVRPYYKKQIFMN